ncbi:uncharacterized protein LOC120255974 [Dioscorea cayenensis subsp. rotundata]|uniref:Uncharacterized protein LOC120255974 n=1 Tax=Dioscorea cayennensis subsp. rotundata TaxID=55577 RepID=A0AB40AX06_DIOCR|nr:uncharacterized protein LOC120255974 [Dioscorea cayenensis subsp. rotundata]
MNLNPERRIEDIALKVEASKQKEPQQAIETDNEDEDDNDVVLLTRKLHEMIKYRESGGFGHYQANCANTLRKKIKSLNARWSDDSDGSTEEDDEGSLSNHHTSFPAVMNESTPIAEYVTTSATTSTETGSEYNEKTMDSMNKGIAKLDEILSVGRTSKSRHGIGYIGESSSVKTEVHIETVSEKKALSKKKSQKKKEKVSKSKRKSFSDAEVEVSPRLKRKCTEAAKQGEKPLISSKKKKKKKATQQVKDSDEDRFLDKASKKKFESFEERGIMVERIIDEMAFEKFGLTKLLQERSLYKSATFSENYNSWSLKSEVKGNYEEELELNEEVLKEITGGRTESWGEETRLPASILTAKYNVLFRLGIQNWLPAPHNSSIVKELALLLFAIGTEADCSYSSTSLGYPALLSQYLLQHGVQLKKGEPVKAVKKLKISQKLFNPGKKIDLPVGRVSPMPEDEEEYEKFLKEQLEDAERRQRALFAELFIIAKQKQNILSRLEILEKKMKRNDDGHDSGGDEDCEA